MKSVLKQSSSTRPRGAGARAVAALRKTYDDSGVPELAKAMEEKMGKEQVSRLSQHARARVFTAKRAPRDMTLEHVDGPDGNRDKPRGADPEETQQWVNALSSKQWLRYREDISEKEKSTFSYMPIDTTTGRVDPTTPKDPMQWTAKMFTNGSSRV